MNFTPPIAQPLIAAESPAHPSAEKYGAIVLQAGFTQRPRSVDDYLAHLNLSPSEILLLSLLETYLREADQEIFPSIQTLARRCNFSERYIRQILARLVQLGLIEKASRYGTRGQTTNYYSLEPLYTKVAAWLNPYVAQELAQRTTQASKPFEPADIFEEEAQALSKVYGDGTPAEMRKCARRLLLRWERIQRFGGEPATFTDAVERAAIQTDARAATETLTGKAFTQLIPYFFSALDYYLAHPHAEPLLTGETTLANPPVPGPQARPVPPVIPGPGILYDTSTHQPSTQAQNQKQAELARRRAERKNAEQAGQPRVPIPSALAARIEDLSAQFNDEQPASSLRRAANLMHDAQIELETLLELIQEARLAACQCRVTKRNKQGQFNRMACFFAILEELIVKLR